MITMVIQRAAVAKDTMSAAAKLAKVFEWWHQMSSFWHGVPHNNFFLAGEVGALDSHGQGVDRLEEQHVYVARTFVEIEVCDRNVLSEASREG